MGPHDHTIVETQVDDLHRAVEQPQPALKRLKPVERRILTLAGQHHGRAGFEDEVPALLPDPHGTHQSLANIGIGLHLVEKLGRRLGRAGSDDERERELLRRATDILLAHGLAVAVDQAEAAAILPDGEGRALDEAHHQRIRQPPLDDRILHPAQRQQPGAGLGHREAEDRLTDHDAERLTQDGFRRVLPAVDDDVADGEAQARADIAERAAQAARRVVAVGIPEGEAGHEDEGDDARRGQDRAQEAARAAQDDGAVARAIDDAAARHHARIRHAGLSLGMSLDLGIGGRRLAHARHCAASTIQAQRAGKSTPQKAACSGNRETGVRPGWVLTSSSTSRPGSPSVSS
jgi:hypothetical protein